MAAGACDNEVALAIRAALIEERLLIEVQRRLDAPRVARVDLRYLVGAEQEEIAGERVEDDSVCGGNFTDEAARRKRRKVEDTEVSATAVIAGRVESDAAVIESDRRDRAVVAA